VEQANEMMAELETIKDDPDFAIKGLDLDALARLDAIDSIDIKCECLEQKMVVEENVEDDCCDDEDVSDDSEDSEDSEDTEDDVTEAEFEESEELEVVD
jgi:hypothetical protein